MRKQIGQSVSVVGNYYVDMISSASIDVITTASPYKEERTQWSLGMDYLRGNTTMSLGYTSSVESDFDASTYSLSVSQERNSSRSAAASGREPWPFRRHFRPWPNRFPDLPVLRASGAL